MTKEHGKLALLTACLCVLLCGCVFKSVDQLYTIPQPTEEYQALQARLSEVTAQGGEYAAPLSGDMIQSVQFQDLDGDGRQEAIAFFRLASEEKPLKIYIFRPVGDTYETMAVIEGAATAINSIDYVQMDDEPYKEIVVSWQLTPQLHTLTVYSVGPAQVEELVRTAYDGYKLSDLDQDNQQELLVFRTPPEGVPQAELYDFDGVLGLSGVAPLSTGAFLGADGAVKSDYLTSLQAGNLAGRVPAVFATSSYGENGAVTDIFVCRDGALKNVTLEPETGESGKTVRYYTQAAIRDVNGDGIMEVPKPVPLVDSQAAAPETMVSYWLVRWQQFDIEGESEEVFTTYYNDRDGWYFAIPKDWEGRLSLSRSDLTGGGERAVIFSRRVDGKEEPATFLIIYKLTGTNRQTRAKRGQRFIIRSDDTTIYAAEFKDGWNCGLTEEQVRARFGVIAPDWYG